VVIADRYPAVDHPETSVGRFVGARVGFCWPPSFGVPVEVGVDGVEEWWWGGAASCEGPVAGVEFVVTAVGAPGSALAYFEGHGVGEGFAGVVVA
jgi:hypothetical protein